MRFGIVLLVAALAAGACSAQESEAPTLGIGDVPGAASRGVAMVEGPRVVTGVGYAELTGYGMPGS